MHAFLTTLADTVPNKLTGDFWMPQSSAVNAAEIDWVFMFVTYISYFFFALIVALLIVFVVRYRQRGREIRAGGPTHHTTLEVTWTVIPLLLSVVIFYFGFKGYLDYSTPPLNSYQIDVTAKQWSWTFRYPNGLLEDSLVVPADRPVKLVMRSDDVLHSLFVPDFRVKKDIVPGRYTTLWFEATPPNPDGSDAVHHLFCAEYCGKDHSTMYTTVTVKTQADFDEWLVDKANEIIRTPIDEHYWRFGPKLYKRCLSCHTLDGTTNTGPSWGPRKEEGLPGIWERTSKGLTVFSDGRQLKDLIGPGKEFETPEDYLRNSMLQPANHVVKNFPATGMSTFMGQLQDKQIDALIQFMKHLDEFDAKGNDLQRREEKAKAKEEEEKKAGKTTASAAP